MRFALFLLIGLFSVCPLAMAEDGAMPPMPSPGKVPFSLDIVPPLLVDQGPATLEGTAPEGTYPILRLTPDKIELVKLDRDAVNVLVGNSAHLMAVMETQRQVILVPRAPGATHFQVLDAQGRTIMQRSVIVAAPKQDYVRIRRACANKDGGGCTEYSVFYCPDMCHAINVTQASSGGGRADVPAETASSGPAGGSGGSGAPEMINDQPVPASAPANVGETTGKMLMTP